MAKALSHAQEAVFAFLADHTSISCSDAIHVGANGRTLSAMTVRGWLFEANYPNGPRVWELTGEGSEVCRQLIQHQENR